MPMVVPVQAISWGGSTTWRVEVRVLGPDFQRNPVPGWTGPWSSTDLTSAFHDGHWSMAEITANTVWGSAWIRSSPSAVAGAFRLISMGHPPRSPTPRPQHSDRPSCDRQLYPAPAGLFSFHRGVGLRRAPVALPAGWGAREPRLTLVGDLALGSGLCRMRLDHPSASPAPTQPTSVTPVRANSPPARVI